MNANYVLSKSNNMKYYDQESKYSLAGRKVPVLKSREIVLKNQV